MLHQAVYLFTSPQNGVYIVNDRKRFVGIGHDCIIQGTAPENQDGMLRYAWWLLIPPRMEIQ